MLPAYSVTSLHFEHSVAPGPENVLTEHILQLKQNQQHVIQSKVQPNS